ncbi:class I SAM-dependent methyltransferase [Permianibacter sp. IMCC34836]|uniref:class I SAM-dependent methyltransferase n=1 Tax=Permianibacter fluminis TaxID=2738515 RepID=UPI00155225E8|nr:methyltransferase domain-containing protein [Permianibacter fluminis]NQD35400.1 class I SAM-dependent methyltransferase [Permianibacter fluminis]
MHRVLNRLLPKPIRSSLVFVLVAVVAVALTSPRSLAADSSTHPAVVPPVIAPAITPAPTITQAIANPLRSDADRKADLYRKPEAMLEFFQVKPGQIVLDVFAGGGYYSELLAHTVGASGRVDAFNNKAYLDWVGDQLAARLHNNRLANVQRIDVEVDELQLASNHYDLILTSMALHDTYYANPEEGWPAMDRPALFKKLFQALKPGGVLAVIDHSASTNRGSQDSKPLHRIEESTLRRDLEQVGFRFDGASDALRNPQDDRSLSSFDPRIRFQTDRFVLRFKRPQ